MPLSRRRLAALTSAFAIFVAGCHASVASPGAPGRGDADGLFEPGAEVLEDLPGVARSRLLALRPDAWDGFATAPDTAALAPTVRLNLFDDASFDVAIDRVARRDDRAVIVEGHVATDPDAAVRLVRVGDAMAATVRTEGRLLTVTPRAGGAHLAREWDEAAAPDDAPSVDPLGVHLPSAAVDWPLEPNTARTLDLLVMYTDAAATGAGGVDALASVVQLAVSEANASFADSGVDGRFVVLAMERTSYDERAFDFETTLRRVRTPGDGFMDDVPPRREELGADHVLLIVDHVGPYAGIGYQMTAGNAPYFASSAYAVVSRDYAAAQLTLAHEVGHNLGADHDPANAGTAYRDDARGHRDEANAFRTVMAYGCTSYCGRVARWSSATGSYRGASVGSAGVEDNARTLNLTVPIASAFRERAVSVLEPAVIQTPADGSTLPDGPVTFVWNDVGADEHVLTIGDAPGSDALLHGAAVTTTAYTTDDLPRDGRTLSVRLYTRHGDTWLFEDATYTAYEAPTFVGARVDFPPDGTSLRSTWTVLAWRAVADARGYRVVVRDASGEVYLDRELGTTRSTLVGDLPTDGRVLTARLLSLGPSGWASRSTRLIAHKVAQPYSRVLTPASGGDLPGARVTFHVSRTEGRARWLVLRDLGHVITAVPLVVSDEVTLDGLPTDGRDLLATVYTESDVGWMQATSTYRAATQ